MKPQSQKYVYIVIEDDDFAMNDIEFVFSNIKKAIYYLRNTIEIKTAMTDKAIKTTLKKSNTISFTYENEDEVEIHYKIDKRRIL